MGFGVWEDSLITEIRLPVTDNILWNAHQAIKVHSNPVYDVLILTVETSSEISSLQVDVLDINDPLNCYF
jgi:hypothetical protein